MVTEEIDMKRNDLLTMKFLGASQKESGDDTVPSLASIKSVQLTP